MYDLNLDYSFLKIKIFPVWMLFIKISEEKNGSPYSFFGTPILNEPSCKIFNPQHVISCGQFAGIQVDNVATAYHLGKPRTNT
jgi:hypothetical protein